MSPNMIIMRRPVKCNLVGEAVPPLH
jgi:hypothetical protein